MLMLSSPHHIFYFPLNKEKSCICYLEAKLTDEIYTEVHATVPNPIIPAEITTWSEEVEEVIGIKRE
jgi:hypothetical protein